MFVKSTIYIIGTSTQPCFVYLTSTFFRISLNNSSRRYLGSTLKTTCNIQSGKFHMVDFWRELFQINSTAQLGKSSVLHNWSTTVHVSLHIIDTQDIIKNYLILLLCYTNILVGNMPAVLIWPVEDTKVLLEAQSKKPVR